MKTINELTRDEKSLLLFIECAQVDNCGLYKTERTNADDRAIMDKWRGEGFIDHGRVASEFLTETRSVWVTLSDEAMTLAQALRRERASRMWANKNWLTTAEKKSL